MAPCGTLTASSLSVKMNHEAFKSHFKTHYEALVARGTDKSVATAEALREAHRVMSLQAQVPNMPAPPTPSALVAPVAAPSPPAALAAPAVAPTPPRIARTLTVEYVQELLEECRQSGSFVPTPLIRAVGSFFSDMDTLMESFEPGDDGNVGMIVDEGVDGAAQMITVDIASVAEVFRLILGSGSEGVGNALLHALESLGFQLQSTSLTHSSPKQMKLYLLSLEMPSLFDPKWQQFLAYLFSALVRTPVQGKLLLVNWIKKEAGVDRFRRHVSLLQQFLTIRVMTGVIDRVTKSAAKLLGCYYAAREEYPEVSESDFHNDAINAEYFRDENAATQEYRLWLTDMTNTKRRHSDVKIDYGWSNTSDVANFELLLGSMEDRNSLVSYPFVLSPASKAKVLELDAIQQMNRRFREERREASMRGDTTFIPFFVICIRRDFLIADSLVALIHGVSRDEDLKRPLKVIFDAEEGVDAGGVRKEYFQLILSRQHLLNPGFGMFLVSQESNLMWFNPHTMENQENFELIGTLLGVAIYNSVLVDCPMPKAIYKKMKGHACNFDDLAELQPDLARGLSAILDFEGDVASTFLTTFQISYADSFGEVQTKDLKPPDGGNTLVTNETRQEFVDLYVKYIFDESVEVQFNAFAKGFNKVCAGHALDLFSPSELEFLLCGSPLLDFDELERGTQYQDGFASDSPAVRLFWQVLHSFTEVDKKRFLRFATGSDRAPIDGLSQLGLILSKNTDEDSRLPSAHTCFNHVLLPAYSSAEILRERLLFALDHNEGFGLR